MGKKMIDKKPQCGAWRGRKSNAGGEKNQKRLSYIHPCLFWEMTYHTWRENLRNRVLKFSRSGQTDRQTEGHTLLYWCEDASNNTLGKISLLIVHALYTYEIGKTAKKTREMSFSPWIGCKTVLHPNLKLPRGGQGGFKLRIR